MGLNAPSDCGGMGLGMLGLVTACEAIARGCSSSALCFGMHCVGTAVITAKATPYQREQYLRPIAEGRHICTLCLAEPGSGSHFYLPATRLEQEGDDFKVTGIKQFVTNGGMADSYVINTEASDPDAGTGDFSCLILDRGQDGMEWQEPWTGLGMRGNQSRGLKMNGVRVPSANLLGEQGDQIWYVFEVVAPFFLMAMSGTYLGIATEAVAIARQHLRERELEHSGETLAEVPVLQNKIAEIWTEVEKARFLIYRAAHLGDLGDPDGLPHILSAKVAAAEAAVHATNECMSLCGGIAYRENGRLARLLRDARAAHVMAPTTEILKNWLGRTLLGQPLL